MLQKNPITMVKRQIIQQVPSFITLLDNLQGNILNVGIGWWPKAIQL